MAVARYCYTMAYTNLCLSVSLRQKEIWMQLMSFLAPDVASSDAALADFVSKLPGVRIMHARQ